MDYIHSPGNDENNNENDSAPLVVQSAVRSQVSEAGTSTWDVGGRGGSGRPCVVYVQSVVRLSFVGAAVLGARCFLW